MKNFLSFMLRAIAVLAAVAAVAYWLSYFITAAGKKQELFSAFAKKSDPEPEPENNSAPRSCGDAVCAVDMCMPY